MANSTYLQLTNKVLNHLNEVNLTSSEFASARGVHQAAKEAVQYAINRINTQHYRWPFNYTTGGSQTLTAGTLYYAIPSDCKILDWNSFYIDADGTVSTSNHKLKPINTDSYKRYGYITDLDNDTSGRGRPLYVMPWDDTGNSSDLGVLSGWAVNPIPNAAYVVKFSYWQEPTQLSAHGDQTTIPSQYDHVILLGAMYYMHIFKENAQGMQMSEMRFEEEIKNMRKVLINKDYQDVYDTRVNFGRYRAGLFSVDTA